MEDVDPKVVVKRTQNQELYIRACKFLDVIPVSLFMRHLEEEKIKLRHHYLGPDGTKACCMALLVGGENIHHSSIYVKNESSILNSPSCKFEHRWSQRKRKNKQGQNFNTVLIRYVHSKWHIGTKNTELEYLLFKQRYVELSNISNVYVYIPLDHNDTLVNYRVM